VSDAARQVTALFAELGFEPELGGEPEAPQIRMHLSISRRGPRSP